MNTLLSVSSVATENERGRCISYRIAKSALNQQTVTIANELKAAGSKIVMIVVDPGDVPTRLIRGNGKTDIDKSVRGIVEIIESATLVDSGSFLKWAGQKNSILKCVDFFEGP